MVAKSAALTTFLKAKGRSNTLTRQAVFRALVGNSPLSMAELIARIPDIDRSSVYRTIGLFEELGVINRLVSGWKYTLELSDLFSDHHHHATCSLCGVVTTFHEAPQLQKALASIGRDIQFRVENHALEIRGLCQKCST